MFLLVPASVFGATDKHTRTFPLPPGRTISLDITIGDVKITGAARADAVLEIVRRAPSDEGLARMPIEIEDAGHDVRIRALQADGQTDPEYRTDVTLQVPSDATLGLVKVMEGRVTLNGLHGAINADIRRGSISGSDVSGTIRLETGIGNVIVDRATLTDGGLLRLRAFNGDVKLSLVRRPAHARVLALALNGTIASDIPLTMKDTWGPRWGEATLGRGDPVISIDVITGKIEIKCP